MVSKWLLLGGYLFLALGMVNNKKDSLPCRAVAPRIVDSLSVHFVTEKDVNDLILGHEGNILGLPLQQVNSADIENLLKTNPFIERAEVFKDIEGVLHLTIAQRHPIARIIRRKAPDVYLDKEGVLLQAPAQSSPVYVLVVTGAKSLLGEIKNKRVEDLPENNAAREIYPVAMFIDSSDFWKRQIEQLYLDANNEIWMIPRVGAHRILLGDNNNIRWKFRKLYLLYTYGLNNVGWNNYESINLKYSNQVICEKRK